MHAQTQLAPAPNVRIGGQEGHDILACKTLLYAARSLDGDPAAPEAHEVAALMAWRNGFTESGPGTHFNEAVHHLHKFTTWALRAEEPTGSKAVKVMKWVGKGLAHMIGKQLSPMYSMKIGTMGADLGALLAEKVKFEQALYASLNTLHQALDTAIQELKTSGLDPARLQECIVQQAVLAHWASKVGLRKGMWLDTTARKAVLGQARADHPDVVLDAQGSSRVLHQRLSLKTLERWGRAALASDPAVLKDFTASVAKARTHAKAEGAKPQGELTMAKMQEMALKALDKEPIQFRHQGINGLEIGGSVGFSTPLASVGTGVGPSVRFTHVKQKTLKIGATIGREIFIGTESRNVLSGAVAGTVSVSLGKVGEGLASFGGVAGFRTFDEFAQETGASIRVSKNVKDHKAQAAKVMTFLFEQAENRKTQAVDDAGLWERFAGEFIDSPVSFNYVDADIYAMRRNGGVAAGVRAGIDPFTFGPLFSTGAEYARTKTAHHEPEGRVTSQTANTTVRKMAAAQVTLAGTLLPYAKVQDLDVLKTVRPPALGIATLRRDFTIPGNEAVQMRLTIEDGKVQPELSRALREFRLESDLFRYIEGERDALELALAGAPGGGKAALDKFIVDVRNLYAGGKNAAGTRVYMERRHLTPDAADKLNFLLPPKQMLQRMGLAGEEAVAAIDGAIMGVLNAPDNWVLDKLAVSEVVAGAIDVGLDFVAVLRSRKQATATRRYLLQLRAIPAKTDAGGSEAKFLPPKHGLYAIDEVGTSKGTKVLDDMGVLDDDVVFDDDDGGGVERSKKVIDLDKYFDDEDH